ncbi:MAG: Bug family tripartite tricarboxylate transporter substrate binding protein [Pararhizobium sp.]
MLKIKTALLALAASTLAFVPAHAAWQPKRPVQFVVASGAGGGTDTFARTVQSIIAKHHLMEAPIVVLNKGGGSGAEAFIYARINKGDPYKVIFGTNNEYLLPLVTKLAYTPDDLEPVAAMAFDEFLIWVNAKSNYKSAEDFIAAAKANPGKIKFAGSQSKDTDQTLVSLIEQKTGAKFTYVPFNGGGEVGVQLAGGHVDANVNNPSENIEQWKAGAVRPLCVFSAKPMAKGPAVANGKGWSDIATCASEGIPVKAYEMPRTIWLPKNVPADAKAYYEDLFKKVSETPEWKAYVERTSQSGEFMTGAAFEQFRKDNAADVSKVFKAEGWAIN